MKLRKSLLVVASWALLAVGPALAQQGGRALPAKTAASTAPAASPALAATSATTVPSAPLGALSAVGPMGTAVAAPVDGQTYTVRLRDLEQRVDELKEQIRRSHTRLSLLSETILSMSVQGSRSEIVFQNDMSNAFRLVKALFVLDG
ncbi:MAG: hypothetical protein RMJ98_17330, partial [Myxococcales bacterium]|nr:hypothetical protein [Polyangiaceae bacterium]MDW8251059.1 hypothetical protein [Myxococcales bacterium]